MNKFLFFFLALALDSAVYASQAPLTLDSLAEKQSIDNLKDFFLNNTIPDQDPSSWISEQKAIFKNSDKNEIKRLATEIFEPLEKGELHKINPICVIPTFIAAIKRYHPDFSVSYLHQLKMIATGTTWYFSQQNQNK